MTDEPQPRTKRLFCNKCEGETNHVWYAEHRQNDDEDDGAYWEATTYIFWVCAGCDTGTLEMEWTSAAMRDQHGQHYDSTYAPPRTAWALAIRRFRQIPDPVKAIYEEVIKAYNSGLRVLCAAGLRALIEGVCADTKIDGRRLEEQTRTSFRNFGAMSRQEAGRPSSMSIAE